MTRPEEAKLLACGIDQYVDALNAMNTFKALIQRTCRRVVEDNLTELGEALGMDLSSQSFSDYEWDNRTGSSFAVGVRVVKRGPHTEIGTSLGWDLDDDGTFECGAYMWVWARKKYLERLEDALRKKSARFESSDSVYLWESVTSKEVDKIDSKLDGLMERWIQLWRKAGGVKVLGTKED